MTKISGIGLSSNAVVFAHVHVGPKSETCLLGCVIARVVINYLHLVAAIVEGTIGILGVGQLSQVYSHLSLRPHLAYDVSTGLEGSEHDDVRPVSDDVRPSRNTGSGASAGLLVVTSIAYLGDSIWPGKHPLR